MVRKQMWMSLRYLVICDKTHFLYVFGHFFFANLKKRKFKQSALFSVYYNKQYIHCLWFLKDGRSVDGTQIIQQSDVKRS